MRFAAIEGGGTTWQCAIALDKPDNFIEKLIIPTHDPETTLGAVREFLRKNTFDAIGIACFGPLDANEKSVTYGYITSTPKAGWRNTNVAGLLGLFDEFSHIPFKFDTDVNAPALAEFDLHAKAKSLTSCAYITVGTGIGVGLVVNGESVKGMMHPEAGHIMVKRCEGDNFKGTCPFHGDCVEGMCSSGALCKRANCTTNDLPGLSDDNEVWDHTAYYIAQLCATLIMVASPEMICIGGGVLNRSCLYKKIQQFTLSSLNGYIQHELLSDERIDQYIKPSFW
jgi:fructokinase